MRRKRRNTPAANDSATDPAATDPAATDPADAAAANVKFDYVVRDDYVPRRHLRMWRLYQYGYPRLQRRIC
jgi:hypothetical protein